MTDPQKTTDAPQRVIPIKAEEAAFDAAKAARREEIVSLYKKTEKVYAREVTGWFTNWRWVMVWVTQLVFYVTPWLYWNDRQAVLFDLGTRRFYLFNLVLYPQDLVYLTALLVISAYGLFLFTTVAGRLWCGYACPQSVYTEMFMWIENKIEGSRAKRMKMDKSPMTAEKFARKAAKHAAWIAVALWTGYTFVGYFSPIRDLWQSVISFGLGPWESFWILFYGFATYGNAGFMREQVCKYMCPYARFQSVMFDRDTLIISYDEKRGEPRGARSRKANAQSMGQGDCIDCTLCVQVCPTGIDIRNGLQYECIACGACIDACDEVMDKMGYPHGLIRYSTQNAIDGKPTRVLRPRIVVYGLILLALVVGWGWGVTHRTTLIAEVLRDRNALYREVGGQVENSYTLKLVNKDQQPRQYRIRLETGTPGIVLRDADTIIQANAEQVVSIPIVVSGPDTIGGRHALRFQIESTDGTTRKTVESSYFGPL